MAKFLHVMICYHYYTPNPQVDEIFETKDPLNVMTIPFRIAFSNAFGGVRVRQAESREITISSVRGTVDRVFVFASDKSRLNGTERDDFIVYYRVSIAGDVDADAEQHLTTNNSTSLKERESVISQISLSRLPLRLAVHTGFIGHRAWISEAFPDNHTDTIACISAFYFYGWMLTIRIERIQLLQDITPKIQSGDKAAQEIIEQRMRLINLERYFLLGDRTNNNLLREICIELSKQFRLDERYRRASARQEAFENHIENTSLALQAQRSASLAKLAFLFTFLSVPFAVMQVLFGLNPESAIYQSAKQIFLDTRTYLVAMAAFAAVAFPMIGFILYDLIREKLRRRRVKGV